MTTAPGLANAQDHPPRGLPAAFGAAGRRPAWVRSEYLNPRARGIHVLKAGTKVSSTSTAPCAHRKAFGSRRKGPRGTLATFDVTKISPPTGGVIMTRVRL